MVYLPLEPLCQIQQLRPKLVLAPPYSSQVAVERVAELVVRELRVESILETRFEYHTLQVDSHPGPVFGAACGSSEVLFASHGVWYLVEKGSG